VVAPVEAAVAPAPQVPEELEAVARATPDLGAVASNYRDKTSILFPHTGTHLGTFATHLHFEGRTLRGPRMNRWLSSRINLKPVSCLMASSTATPLRSSVRLARKISVRSRGTSLASEGS
jgi:hypothetical protein